MDINKFLEEADQQEKRTSEFSEFPKLVIANGVSIRLIGDYRKAFEHFVTNAEGQTRPYYCGGPESDCKLCALAVEWSASDNEELKTQAVGNASVSGFIAKERFYFNCIDRSPVGMAWHSQNKKTKLLVQNEKGSNIGPQMFIAIGNVAKMRKQMGQDPNYECYDILLQKTGTKQSTKYSCQFTGVVTPLTDEERNYELVDLDVVARPTSKDDINEIVSYLQRKNNVVSRSNAAVPGPYERPKQAAQMQTQQQKPKLKMQVSQPTHMDTRPRANANMETNVEIPCSNCGETMLIDQTSTLDIKCWKCSTVYTHPNAL